MTKSKKSVTAKPQYEPTEQELSALEKIYPPHGRSSPGIKIEKNDGVAKLGPDHPDPTIGYALLAQDLGTADADFLMGLVKQLAAGTQRGDELDEEEINFILSIVKGVKPRDEIEAMLAAQMAAVHKAAMTFARRLARVETLPKQDSAERAFNKLTRTFATQMEALKRYRTGGEQKVTVQHVSVSEGGQAIVGNVTQAPRENASEKPAPAALTHDKSVPMPILPKGKERVRERRQKQ